MRKLLILTPHAADGCAWYRATGPCAYLREHGWDAQLIPSTITWADLAGVDAILMQRSFSVAHVQAAELIRQMGIPLWVDYDDHLLDVPRSNPSHSAYHSDILKGNIKRILALANAVSVSTQALADAVSPYCLDDPMVIRNAWNDYAIPIDPPHERRDVILWRGGPSHEEDMLTYRHAIAEVVQETGLRLVCAGMVPWMLDGLTETEWMPLQRIPEYLAWGRMVAPRVAICPLKDSAFNRCKSDIAYLEYTAFGAVSVVPDWPEWDRPGAVGYSSPEDFAEAVYSALDASADSAVEYVRDNRVLSHVNRERIALLDAICG